MIKAPDICQIQYMDKLHSDVMEALGADSSIEIDCSDVRKVDSSFLQLMLAIEKSNITLALKDPSEAVLNILKLYQLEIGKGA